MLHLTSVFDGTTSPFRFACLIELNDANAVQVQLGNAATNFWSGSYFLGSTAGFTPYIGARNLTSIGSAGIPAGTRFWFMIVGDGTRVTASVSTAVSPTAVRLSNQAGFDFLTYASVASTNVNFSNTTFASISRVQFQVGGTSRILGFFCNNGSWDGATDNALNPPGVFESSPIFGDPTPYILIPGTYATPTDKKVICFNHHPNGNSGSLFELPTAQPTYLNLWMNGYAVIGGSGQYGDFYNPNDITGATGSNWGSLTGMTYRKSWRDAFTTRLPSLTKVVHLGSSMGGLSALGYENLYPGAKAIVVVSGAVNMTICNTSLGFAGTQNNAYGDFYVCIQAGTGQTPASSPAFWTKISPGSYDAPPLSYYLAPYNWKDRYVSSTAYSVNDIVMGAAASSTSYLASYDPNLNYLRYVNVPISMYHSTADTVIPIGQMTDFANGVNAAGGNVITTTQGTGHITADVYSPTAILAFFNSKL
jgi:pimeloyl-ACP methyl ester carboxylesterase